MQLWCDGFEGYELYLDPLIVSGNDSRNMPGRGTVLASYPGSSPGYEASTVLPFISCRISGSKVHAVYIIYSSVFGCAICHGATAVLSSDVRSTSVSVVFVNTSTMNSVLPW